MAAKSLESIDCSIQPLDFSFHPTIDIVAAGLVDGTVEGASSSVTLFV